MSKRFTDTEKWARPWFRELSSTHQMLWNYICDKCDISGVWYVDIQLANFYIGGRTTKEKAEQALAKQIQIFDEGRRWWIIDYIPFQYGKALSMGNRLHASVIRTLENHGLSIEKFRGIANPLEGAKDKDIVLLLKEGGVGETKDTTLTPTPQKLMELWNRIAHPNLSRVKDLTETRKRHINARLKDNPQKEFWISVFERVNRSPFLTGLKSDWRCNFDWVMNPTNLTKIKEGNYDNR